DRRDAIVWHRRHADQGHALHSAPALVPAPVREQARAATFLRRRAPRSLPSLIFRDVAAAVRRSMNARRGPMGAPRDVHSSTSRAKARHVAPACSLYQSSASQLRTLSRRKPVKQALTRARALAMQGFVFRGACASLPVLACGGGSESAAPDDVPIEPIPSVLDEPPRDTPSGVTPVAGAPPADGGRPVPDVAAPGPEPAAAPEPAPEPRVCDASVSFGDLYGAVADDLNDEGDDGVFLRYVSIGNRLAQGICPEDLGADRE